MIDVIMLNRIIDASGLGVSNVANKLGMSKKSFCAKLSRGVLGSQEMEKLVEILKIQNPTSIFFAK